MAFNFDSEASTPPYVGAEEEVDFSGEDFTNENDFLGLEVEDFSLDKSVDGLPSLADWTFAPNR